MDRWSGPGKALETHLVEYEDARRNQKMVMDLIAQAKVEGGEKNVRLELDKLPARINTWARFAATYTYWERDEFNNVVAEGNPIMDGMTNASPEVALEKMLDDPRLGATAKQMLDFEWAMLAKGVTHYISEEITDTVAYAAAQAEPEPLFPTDLPTPYGFCIFERPFIIHDLHPDTGLPDERFLIPVRAIAWCSTPFVGAFDEPDSKPGVVVFTYTDKDSYDEVYVPSASAALGRPVAPGNQTRFLYPLDACPWQFGRSWHPTPDTWKPGEIPTNVAMVRQFFLALCRFMWQEIIVAERHDPDRAQKRRLDRAQFPGEGYIKVLHLRRKRNLLAEHNEGDGETLQYRIRVRGHWRRVYCPTLGPARNPDGTWNQESHRLKWIEEYERGPEDGPFIDGFDLTAVTR